MSICVWKSEAPMMTGDYEESCRSCWCPGHIFYSISQLLQPSLDNFPWLMFLFPLPKIPGKIQPSPLTRRWPSTAWLGGGEEGTIAWPSAQCRTALRSNLYCRASPTPSIRPKLDITWNHIFSSHLYASLPGLLTIYRFLLKTLLQ